MADICHNTPGLPEQRRGMNRRHILASTPAFGLAGLFAAGASPTAASEAETPVMVLHRKITQAQELLNHPGKGLSDDEANAICDRMMDMADEIVEIPCEGPMDMLLKIMGHTINGDHETGDCPRGAELWAEARALVGGAA